MKSKSSKSKNKSLHGNMERLKRLKRSREKSQEKQKKSLRSYPYYPYHKRDNKTENKTETVNISAQQNLNLPVAEPAVEAVPKPDTLSNSTPAPEPVSASDSAATSASVTASVTASISAKISKENPDKRFHRLEIWFADLGEPKNDKFIEAGWHPVLIISNDTNNELSPIVTVAPISSKTNKLYLPGHVFIDSTDVDSTGVCGNVRGMRIINYPFRPGSILLEQITVLDKRQLEKYAGKITAPERIKTLNKAIGAFLGI